MLAAMLLATASAFAQERKPMLVQGKTWHYIYHHFEDKAEPTGEDYPEDFYDETCYEVSYTVQGDTVIEGRKYMKIYRRDDRGVSKYYGAFREDEEGLVWQYDLMGDKKDFMLCDYTCLHYPGSWPEVGDIVDVVNIYGQLLHRHSWNGMLGVEGVGMAGKGLVHYLFGEEPDCICDYESFAYVEGGGIWFTAADFMAPKYINLTQEEKQLVERNNDFAFCLFRKARSGENLVLSPLSITYALGMLNNGAAGQTQQEIGQVLGFNDVLAQNEFCQKMKLELAGTQWYDNTTALISNTMFVNKGMGWQLKPDFAQKCSQYYMANPQNRDFGDGETRDVINKWGSDHTEGMIKEVLSEQEYNPLAVSYLLNAIYFKGLWSTPFEAGNTREEPFAGAPVPMMSNVLSVEYAEDELCQTVVLPYGNGSYQMQVFLPREGKTLGELAESLNGKNWRMRGYSCEVDLKLPRFETSTNINLKPIMAELGMPTAFDPNKADFSELVTAMQGENLYIGLMKQVAKIEVNEQGTKAAAVTVIGLDGTAMPQTATFHANRPFLYVISEQSTGIILFMGQYMGKEDVTDSIEPRLNQLTETGGHGNAYDLQGRRIENGKLSKGLYIVDGRKVIVR